MFFDIRKHIKNIKTAPHRPQKHLNSISTVPYETAFHSPAHPFFNYE